MYNYAAVYPIHFFAQKGNLVGLSEIGTNFDYEHWKNIINSRDHRGITVMHQAMEGGNFDLVKFLFERGGDVNLICIGDDPYGWASIHFAAFFDRVEIINYLVSKGANVNIDSGTKEHFTPLRVAITRQHNKSALRLIELGADINTKDDHGYTLLHEAANMELPDVVKALIIKGANVNARVNGKTPLSYAIKRDNKKIIKI